MAFCFALCPLAARESKLGKKHVARHVRGLFLSPGFRNTLIYQERKTKGLCCHYTYPRSFLWVVPFPNTHPIPCHQLRRKLAKVPTKWAVGDEPFSGHLSRPVWVTFQPNSYAQLQRKKPSGPLLTSRSFDFQGKMQKSRDNSGNPKGQGPTDDSSGQWWGDGTGRWHHQQVTSTLQPFKM